MADNPFLEGYTEEDNPFLTGYDLALDNPFLEGYEQEEARRPGNIVTSGLDLLSRTNYGVAKFADTLASDGAFALGKALKDAAIEVVDPRQRLQFADLIRKHQPEFAGNNPVATELLGLAGDIATDPLTYITFGTKDAIKIPLGASVKALNKKGVSSLANIMQRSPTREIAEREFISLLDSGALKDVIDKGGMKFAGKTLIPGDAISKLPGFNKIADIKARLNELKKAGRPKTSVDVGEVAEMSLIIEPPQVGTIRPGQKALLGPGSEIPYGIGQREEIPLGFANVGSRTATHEGLSRLEEASVKAGKLGRAARTLVRGAGIDEPVMDAIHSLEGQADEANKRWFQIMTDTMTGMNEKERKQMQLFLTELDDATGLKKKEFELAGLEFTSKEAESLRMAMFQGSSLNPKQKAVAAQLSEHYNKAKRLEMEAAMLEGVRENYNPRVYAFRPPEELHKMRLYRRKGLSGFLGPDEWRSFESRADAERAGYVLEMDALPIAIHRMADSDIARAQRETMDYIKAFYGVDKADDLPKNVLDELRFVGDSEHSIGGENEFYRTATTLWDSAMRLFRSSATVLRPFFGGKQVFSNIGQIAAEQGRKSLGIANPKVLYPSLELMLLDGGNFKTSLHYAHGTERGDAILGKQMRSALNERFTVGDIWGELRGNGLISSTNMSGDSPRRLLSFEMAKLNLKEKLAGNSSSKRAMINILEAMTDFTAFPSHIENFFKTATYLNARMIGHNPKQAAALTRRALFDYSHGLSAVERQVIRRFIMPFYSYPRFAAKLLGSTLLHTPGRVSNLNKTVESFLNAYGKLQNDEPMTESERRLTPDWILEQPHAQVGWTDDYKATYHAFNNFNFLDTFNLLEESNGKIDGQRTAQRAFLATIAPHMKVPLEIALNKNFFSGAEIKSQWTPGGKKRIGTDVSPEQILTAILTTAGSAAGKGRGLSTLGAVAGRMFGPAASKMGAADIVKNILGWEETTNAQGQKEVWINPYSAHVATSIFPSLGTWIRFEDGSKTPRQHWLEMFGGVNVYNRDLRREASMKYNREQRKLSQLSAQASKAYDMGATQSGDKLREEYLELLQTIQEDWAPIDMEEVRGGGY